MTQVQVWDCTIKDVMHSPTQGLGSWMCTAARCDFLEHWSGAVPDAAGDSRN